MPLQPLSDIYRRRLLATGTGEFDNHATLSQVPDEVETIKSAFGALNYEVVPAQLDLDPRELQDLIFDACADCTENDLLVLYYTGHGESDNQLYLLSRGSKQAAEDHPALAVKVVDLAEILIKARASQVLLILDVCYAGTGAGDFLRMAADLTRQRPSLNPAYVIAATRSRDEADEGALSKALAKALANPDCQFGGATQRYLAMDEVMEAIREYLAERFPKQEAQLAGANLKGRCLLFPNPQYRPYIDPGLDLARQRVFDEHWLPKSGGLEGGWGGSYFTGRHRALRQIGEWLSQVDTHGRALVVTGGPGTGKSALLGRIVSLSEPRFRDQVLAVDGSSFDAADVLPEGIVDVAIHARHKLLSEVLNEIANKLGLSDRDLPSMLESLEKRGRKTVIVIDALDEAADSQTILQQLLLPLATFKHVFLLVGTRPDATSLQQRFEGLGPDTVEVNLEHSLNTEPGEVALYVERRLLASEEPRCFTPYRKHPEIARKVAEAVAQRAKNVFLVAHTVALRLFKMGKMVDTSRPGWMDHLSTELTDAFNQYLAPLEEEKEGLDIATARAVLLALAFAEGEGLPWADIWRSVASALSGQTITDANIIAVRKYAAPFIVESMEGDRSVYRLYHEQLAEHLLESDGQAPALSRHLWEALLACVPANTEGRHDWLRAHPYLKRHAASFAVKAGMLQALLDDPAFLVVSDPAILRRYLNPQSSIAQPMVQAYLRVFGALRELPEAERRSYLSLASQQSGIDKSVPLPDDGHFHWMPVWATWNPPEGNTVLVSRDSRVTALSLGQWGDGTSVALVGREDGLVEVFQLDNGRQLAAWQPMVGSFVSHLAIIATPGGEVLVASGGEGWLATTNLRSKRDIHVPFVEQDGRITALTVCREGDRFLCVSAHERKLARTRLDDRAELESDLRVWDLTDLGLLHLRVAASRARILDVAVVLAFDGLRILSAGDSFFDGARCARTLKMWTLDLEFLWQIPATIESECISSIRLRTVGGATYAVTNDFFRAPRIWQVLSEEMIPVYCAPEDKRVAWLGESQASPILYLLAEDGAIENQIIEVTNPVEISSTSTSVTRTDGYWTEQFRTDCFNLDTSHFYLSSNAGSVNMWSLKDARSQTRALQERQFFPGHVKCMFMDSDAANTIYFGTAAGEVVAIDEMSGNLTWTCEIIPNQRIHAITGYVDEGKLLLVVAIRGVIWLVPAGGQPDISAVIQAGDDVTQVQVAWIDDEPMVVASVSEANVSAVRIWSLRSKLEINTLRNEFGAKWNYQLSYGEEDKPIMSLVCHAGDAGARIVFASKYSQIMVAQHPVPPSEKPRLSLFDTWRIPGSSISAVLSLAQSADGELIAAGTDSGRIALWHYPSGVRLACQSGTHLNGRIQVLAFCDARPSPLLASGGEDGVVRFWDGELNALFQINIHSPIRGICFTAMARMVVATHNGVVMIALDEQMLEASADRIRETVVAVT
ncbi:AAA family ATPase [Pseudomonas sp. CP4]|uniref:AAA family ATPase n=1 Tax=Pseudomonas sp. CP4 TaxID=3388844 RepID=UPI0039EF2245